MQIYCSISRILSTYDGQLRQLFKTTLKTKDLPCEEYLYCCKYGSSGFKLFWSSVQPLFLPKLSLSILLYIDKVLANYMNKREPLYLKRNKVRRFKVLNSKMSMVCKFWVILYKICKTIKLLINQFWMLNLIYYFHEELKYLSLVGQ